jgi:hypothetical protein
MTATRQDVLCVRAGERRSKPGLPSHVSQDISILFRLVYGRLQLLATKSIQAHVGSCIPYHVSSA